MSHLGQMRACGGGIATPAAPRSRVAMTGRDTARQAAPDAIEGLRPGGRPRAIQCQAGPAPLVR